MPGPRRKKPPKHSFPDLVMPPGVSEVYLMEWFEFGLGELREYLERRWRFADYLSTHPRPDDPADLSDPALD